MRFLGGTNPTRGPGAIGGDAWRWDGSFPNGHGLTPPAGLYEPVRGFGFVWYNFLGRSSGQLGWATAPEQGICVTLQPFVSGIMFKSSTVARCQDNLYNHAQSPTFVPILIAIKNDGGWRRY